MPKFQNKMSKFYDVHFTTKLLKIQKAVNFGRFRNFTYSLNYFLSLLIFSPSYANQFHPSDINIEESRIGFRSVLNIAGSTINIARFEVTHNYSQAYYNN